MHAPGTQTWVVSESTDRGEGPEVGFPPRLLGRARFIRQATKPFLNPAVQGGVHRHPARLEIVGDRFRVPALGMSANNGHAPRGWITDFVERWVAPLHLGRWRHLS